MDKCFRISQFIFFASLGSLLLYLLIALNTSPALISDPLDPETLRLLLTILLTLSFLEIIGIYYLRRFLMRKNLSFKFQWISGVTGLEGQYITAIIVSMAIAGGIGIYGLIYYFLSNDLQTLYLFLAISAAAMIIYRPRPEELQDLKDENMTKTTYIGGRK